MRRIQLSGITGTGRSLLLRAHRRARGRLVEQGPGRGKSARPACAAGRGLTRRPRPSSYWKDASAEARNMVQRNAVPAVAMNIGEVAAAVDLPVKTLRYYEEIGLVVPQ